MTIRNIQVVGTFDETNAGFQAQANIFAAVLQNLLRGLSGVDDLGVRDLGPIKVKGGLTNIVRAQVKIPKAADDPSEKERGSRVGLQIIGETFRQGVDAELLSQTQVTSALVGLETSIDIAISQFPPGLVVEAPGAGIALSITERTSKNGTLFSITPDADVAAAATASMTLKIDPIVSTNISSATYEILGPNSDTVLLPDLLGGWSVVGTEPLDVGGVVVNYVKTTDTPSTVGITKDGVASGTAFQGGDITTAPVRLFQNWIAGKTAKKGGGFVFFFDALIQITYKAAKAAKGVVLQEILASEPVGKQESSVVTWTNDTGALVTAGTVIGDLRTSSVIITEEL